MDRRHADEAVRAGDVDELLRIVDGARSAREWDELERLRARCAAASEAGHQLWPVASRAAYLLALEAPPELAAAVLVDGAGRFAPGPLPEVAAQAHRWADLEPHIPAGPLAVVTAHERVLRGDDLRDATVSGPPVLELPLRLADWEPSYALAEYRPDSASFPAPELPSSSELDEIVLPDPDRAVDDVVRSDDVTDALRSTVRAWADESSGTVTVAGVPGGAHDAMAALDSGPVAIARLDASAAMAQLAWAGSSGGAHAPRPGAAAGRFSAWWVAGALTGLLDDWPPDPVLLGARIADLEWSTWQHAGGTAPGWSLCLAVADPERRIAWAVRAHDTT